MIRLLLFFAFLGLVAWGVAFLIKGAAWGLAVIGGTILVPVIMKVIQ
jgi:hypothetical protein